MTNLAFIALPTLWLTVLGTVLAVQKVRPNWQHLWLYMVFMSMLGPVGEIFVGTMYQAVFGVPLWQYQFFPIHHGYTSLYAPVAWAVGGAALYVMREVLHLGKKANNLTQHSIGALEVLVSEVALNASFFVLSGHLLFYYTPGDLWHLTSVQTLPFYFLMSIVVSQAITRFKKDVKFFGVMCLCLMIVVVFMAR